MKKHRYYIYITTNPQKTMLYIGVTNNLNRRMEEHRVARQQKPGSFSGRYACFNLIYAEFFGDIRVAIAREKQLKGWTRKKKIALIEAINPDWRFYYDPGEIAKGDLPPLFSDR